MQSTVEIERMTTMGRSSHRETLLQALTEVHLSHKKFDRRAGVSLYNVSPDS